MTEEGLMPKIKSDLDHMDPSFAHGGRLLQQEMERLESGDQPKSPMSKEEAKYLEITKEKPIRLQVKVVVPVKEHPRFNFVGKLLGPKGNSLKRLQEETMTKMAILGKGSMRDKAKEEELRQQNDPKYAHLSEDLHVEINAFASPAEAYARISHALMEIKKFLVPVSDYNDEIRQTQLQELAYINGSAPTGPPPGTRGRGRGVPPPPPMGGHQPVRSGRGGLLATPPAPRAITSRPGAALPPPPPGRPVMAPGRAAAARVPAPPPPRVATYRTAVADTRTYDDGYEYQDAYEQSDQYYDYHGTNPMEAYEDEYAADQYAVAEDWRPGNDTPRLKAPPARPSPRGAYREHPYPPQIPRY